MYYGLLLIGIAALDSIWSLFGIVASKNMHLLYFYTPVVLYYMHNGA